MLYVGRRVAAPKDSDAAFNFFVTAEHMLDWVYPKRSNGWCPMLIERRVG
jgi:hypothetical protein